MIRSRRAKRSERAGMKRCWLMRRVRSWRGGGGWVPGVVGRVIWRWVSGWLKDIGMVIFRVLENFEFERILELVGKYF